METTVFDLRKYDFDKEKIIKLTDFGHNSVKKWLDRMKIRHVVSEYVKEYQHTQKYSIDYFMTAAFQLLSDDYQGIYNSYVVIDVKDENGFSPLLVMEYSDNEVLVVDALRHKYEIISRNDI